MLEVIENGIFTTVQDLGRYGYQRYGVPVSGAMDQFSIRVANILVGNAENDAGLEITLVGPRIRFLDNAVIALAGGQLGAMVDDRPIENWRSVAVPAGACLSFNGQKDGMRAYLAVAGGIDVPRVLGSRSTFTRAKLGGLDGRQLMKRDTLGVLHARSNSQIVGSELMLGNIPKYGNHHILRVTLGPQDNWFTEKGLRTLLYSTYTVSFASDRMGSRLIGPVVEHKKGADIVSDGTSLGAIQITGEGLPIILLADRGTTGGYTKIANVISVDLALIAQAQIGDTVQFRSVTLNEAHRALREQEKVITELKFTTER